MKIKVSKVFAKFVNEVAEEFGKKFHAEVVTRRLRPYENWCDDDYNWETGLVRELVVTYPPAYYACPRIVRTDELVAEFNSRGVKTWDGLKRMVVDMFEV